MSVRRLAPKELQPASFTFSEENLAWAKAQIEKYPPGRQAGITQWDLCAGIYAGGKHDLLSEEARTALFHCPSARRKNGSTR